MWDERTCSSSTYDSSTQEPLATRDTAENKRTSSGSLVLMVADRWRRGQGWRFVLCLQPDGFVGFTGTAYWHVKLPGALGKELQGGNGLAKSPNPSPVLALYGPAADTVDYQLAIGFSGNRFLLYYVRTCVPDFATGGGNFALFPGWVPRLGADGTAIRMDRGKPRRG